jgi:hypothetical protein
MNMKYLLSFSLALLISVAAFGLTVNRWIGPSSGDWNLAANWSAGIPAAGDWVQFDQGGTINVYNIPWHNSVLPWRNAPGNKQYDLGYLWIINSTIVLLHGGTGWPGTIVSRNIEIRLSGVPMAAPGPDKTFYISTGSKLDLTNPDGQKVALDLAPHTFSLLEVYSWFDNGLPFEYLYNPPDQSPFSVHALKLESYDNPSGMDYNIAFKQLNGNAIQNVFVQISPGSDDQWHFFSPPVCPAILCSTFDSDFVFKYNNLPDTWDRVSDPLPYNLTTGQGYELWAPSGTSHPEIWECNTPPACGAAYSSYHVFNGTLNGYQSRQSWNLFGGNSGWELIGNPYASAIKIPFTPGWTGAHSASPNPHTLGLPGHPVNWYWESTLNPHLQMWNPLVGHYSFWDFRFATGTALNYPAGVSPEIIPAMQGFFVERNATFMTGPNNLEVGQPAQLSLTYTPIFKPEGDVQNFLKLTVSGNRKSDQLGIIFQDDALTGKDSYDGKKLPGDAESPQLYAVTDDNEHVVFNVLPPGNHIIPVGLQVGVNGNYSIHAEMISSFSPHAEIILTDAREHVSRDLRMNPVYPFTAKADDDANRFMLFFANLLPFNNGSGKSSAVHIVESGLVIQMKDQNSAGSIKVYDRTGKVVSDKILDKGYITRLKTNLENGIYMVTVLTDKGSDLHRIYLKPKGDF